MSAEMDAGTALAAALLKSYAKVRHLCDAHREKAREGLPDAARLVQCLAQALVAGTCASSAQLLQLLERRLRSGKKLASAWGHLDKEEDKGFRVLRARLAAVLQARPPNRRRQMSRPDARSEELAAAVNAVLPEAFAARLVFHTSARAEARYYGSPPSAPELAWSMYGRGRPTGPGDAVAGASFQRAVDVWQALARGDLHHPLDAEMKERSRRALRFVAADFPLTPRKLLSRWGVGGIFGCYQVLGDVVLLLGECPAERAALAFFSKEDLGPGANLGKLPISLPELYVALAADRTWRTHGPRRFSFAKLGHAVCELRQVGGSNEKLWSRFREGKCVRDSSETLLEREEKRRAATAIATYCLVGPDALSSLPASTAEAAKRRKKK